MTIRGWMAVLCAGAIILILSACGKNSHDDGDHRMSCAEYSAYAMGRPMLTPDQRNVILTDWQGRTAEISVRNFQELSSCPGISPYGPNQQYWPVPPPNWNQPLPPRYPVMPPPPGYRHHHDGDYRDHDGRDPRDPRDPRDERDGRDGDRRFDQDQREVR